MKYCLFESGDVVGPAPIEELLRREGFGPSSLVCPEAHSEEQDYWKPAQEYADFHFQQPGTQSPSKVHLQVIQKSPVSKDLFTREMHKTIEELETVNKLDADAFLQPIEEAPVQEAQISALPAQLAEPEPRIEPPQPSPQPQQPPAQISPIEEYFKTMSAGDLGNILGIPDVKINSDLNLTQVLENQLEKTDPPAAQQPSPQIETLQSVPPVQLQQGPVATPDDPDRVTEQTLKRELMDLQAPTVAHPPAAHTEQEAIVLSPTEETPVVSVEEESQEAAVPLVTEPSQAAAQPTAQQEPVSSATVAQAQPAEYPTADWLAKKPIYAKGWKTGFLLVLFLAVLLAGLRVFFVRIYGVPVPQYLRPSNVLATSPALTQAPAVEAEISPVAVTEDSFVEENVDKVVEPPALTPGEMATQIVQTYSLGASRGSIADYLTKRYAAQLADGYIATWSAEPLHKEMYVVKYRLAKTRKEPIVYIFQVDTVKNKLTGALNNITLDLVGKIQ